MTALDFQRFQLRQSIKERLNIMCEQEHESARKPIEESEIEDLESHRELNFEEQLAKM